MPRGDRGAGGGVGLGLRSRWFFLLDVFAEELPDIPKARLGAFVGGVASFFVMREISKLGGF